MKKIKKVATALSLLTLGLFVHVTNAQAWVFNGAYDPFIPFWYTLEEALCRHMISWC